MEKDKVDTSDIAGMENTEKVNPEAVFKTVSK